MSPSKKVPRDAFVTRVKKDAKSADSVVQVQGFVGDSSEEGHFRLYADASLNNFVDIPERDVIHVEKMDAKESPLGGSYIWLNQDAAYVYGSPDTTNRPRARFLEGDITEAQQTGTVGYTPNSWYVGCNSGWHTCRSHFWTECFGSFRWICPVTRPLTTIITRTSAVDACPSALGCTIDWQTRYVGNDYAANTNPRRFGDAGFDRFNPMR